MEVMKNIALNDVNRTSLTATLLITQLTAPKEEPLVSPRSAMGTENVAQGLMRCKSFVKNCDV